jgi:hypothetical protein
MLKVMVRRPHRVLGVLLGLVLAAALAACGSSGSTAPIEIQSLSQVTSATNAEQSAAFELALEMSFGDQAFDIRANGAFDAQAEKARLEFDLSSLAKLLGGFGEAFGAKAGDLEGLDDPEQWKLEAIQDGSVLYLRFPLLGKQLPAGKEWIRATDEQLSQLTGQDLGQLGGFASSDPRDVLEALESVSGSLVTVGTEDVRGTSTTHVRAMLDPEKLIGAGAASGASGDVLDSFRAALREAGLAELPVDVWVDAEGRVRKLTMALDAAQGGMASGLVLTLELYDYGTEVDVAPPDPATVVDATALKPTP